MRIADQYIYYRIFNDAGPLQLTDPFDASDDTVNRVHVNTIAPPRDVGKIKARIMHLEGLSGNSQLYLNLEDVSPAEDSQLLNLSSSRGPGSDPEHLLGLVLSELSGGDQPGQSKDCQPTVPEDIDLTGSWTVEEHGGETTSRGVYIISMTSPMTFTGFGTETDTFTSSGSAKYSFAIVEGTITSVDRIEWVCVSEDIPGTWKVQASLNGDHSLMAGIGSAVTGNVIDMEGTYKRLV